jgi:hypothetical protein
MTTRSWMILVALVGLLLGGIVGCCRLAERYDLAQRHYRYHMRVLDWCTVQETAVRDSSRIYDRITDVLEGRKAGLDMILGLLPSRPLADADQPTVARLHRITAHHRAMARKYQDAVRHLWWPVAPDPPQPVD